MIPYTSTRGQIPPTGFDQVLLQGFAPDGGLFVPCRLPRFTPADLEAMAGLAYPDLAREILGRFIPADLVPGPDLDTILKESFAGFSHGEVLPLVSCPGNPRIRILELFHGPTLSFKDIAMGVLVRLMDYFLAREDRLLNLVLATTGDTGPAAAHAAAGRAHLNCWPLFPLGMITPEQQAQMTAIQAPNIHPVGVDHCPDGGDDLDRVILSLFKDPDRRRALKLSSVNSINWCRVLVQSVHYAYAYFKTCRALGQPVVFSVPSGAAGNLTAGMLAGKMGLPLRFICSGNANQTLYRLFTSGLLKQSPLIPTPSSAIDIVVPYNVWRLLYFANGGDAHEIRDWMDAFDKEGDVRLPRELLADLQKTVTAVSITDDTTLGTMRAFHRGSPAYLPDPHTAVALAGALARGHHFGADLPVVCLATAHPAKFPDVVARALGLDPASGDALPPAAVHPGLEAAKAARPNLTRCPLEELEQTLVTALGSAVTTGTPG